MARPLRESPPSSAVARLLDVGAASRALAQPRETSPCAHSAVVPTHEPVAETKLRPEANVLVKREFVLTPSTDEILCGFVELIRRSTGARLSGSHLLRALLVALHHARPSLETEARRLGSMKLPSNARGKETERLRFERRITAALVAGLRASATFDPDA
jgi:hypothetical protein